MDPWQIKLLISLKHLNSSSEAILMTSKSQKGGLSDFVNF